MHTKKIAIHNRPGSFSDIWLKYCQEKNIPYKMVSCSDSDIMLQLADCAGLMWHWDSTDYKSELFARQLTLSLERKGIKVFPDSNTAWHYDDKIGQKYLLEAIKVPFIPTHIFYRKDEAVEWARNTVFPKVFKLRGGAGSTNVKLVKNKDEAIKLIQKAFTSGFLNKNPISRFKERLWILKRDKNFNAVKKVATGLARLVLKMENERFSAKQIGYIYFQDFVPDNDSDTRLVVVGNKCFGLTRYTRKNDFRASGSGLADYNHKLIHPQAVKLAFLTAEKLKTQSVALDFIRDKDEYKIIEISYAFVSTLFPGYWDRALNWHEQTISPQREMVENFVNEIYQIPAEV